MRNVIFPFFLLLACFSVTLFPALGEEFSKNNVKAAIPEDLNSIPADELLFYKELQKKRDDAPLLFARLEDFVRRKKSLPSKRILPLAYDNTQEQLWFCNFLKKQQDHSRPLQLRTLINLKNYVERRVIFNQNLASKRVLKFNKINCSLAST